MCDPLYCLYLIICIYLLLLLQVVHRRTEIEYINNYIRPIMKLHHETYYNRYTNYT